MSLASLLNQVDFSENQVKIGLSEERVRNQIDNLRNIFSFFRMYPDLMIDFIKGPNCNFQFYFYQRVFIRIVMRHRYVYATFPRAFSKSFLSMMVLMIRCILYPGAELFITTGGKEQAASITIAKINEICKLIPALNREIDWTRGETKKSKDDVVYTFKNGSKINILAARDSSRGQRRTGGLMEEVVLIDQTALNEIVIPTTNVNRLLPDGTRHKEETVNKSQIYITTAGYKNTFAYSKLIELLVQSVIDPDEVMILGGTYQTPVTEGLLDEDFVDQLKLAGTFNEDSFEREYCSIWTGDIENAFFSAEKFDRHRVLALPELEISNKRGKDTYYVIGVDVGRIGCTTEACVFKVAPNNSIGSLKSLVNIYTYDAEHFEDQAINLKRLFYKYKAVAMAVDANGIGVGLVDYLIKQQVDPESGDVLPPFGVMNDEENKYKKYKTENMEPDALFLIKANAPFNTEAYSYAQTQMQSGKIKFLVDEAAAKERLMSTKRGQDMKLTERNEYLKPYVQTSILREQLLNLIEENEGINIILKQSSRKIKKDKVSAFVYGLYYIKIDDERRKKKKRFRLSEMMFFS